MKPRIPLSGPRSLLCPQQLTLPRRQNVRFISTSRPNSSSDTSSSAPATTSPERQVIFSGIQPTGTPHLGNYLGALKSWVKLQDEAPANTKLIFSIVDLHAITSVSSTPSTDGLTKAQELRQRTREMLAALLAVGIRPERSTVFVQSQVAQHCEMHWLLSCTASMGYLGRMTQWKSKLNLGSESNPLDESSKSKLKLGLFSYPVLQAADILVHGATHVPVGEDQSQHLEFARECVTNFNANYGEVLVKPRTILSATKRIMSLTSPLQKMSKSHPSASSRLLISDPPSLISSKLRTAVTDSENSISYDPVNRPGVSNLLDILAAFDEQDRCPERLAQSMKGMGLGALKTMVGEAVGEGLRGVRGEYERLLGDEGYLDEVQRKGTREAMESAEVVMSKVREAVGLGGGL